jgi:hypothetical protein
MLMLGRDYNAPGDDRTRSRGSSWTRGPDHRRQAVGTTDIGAKIDIVGLSEHCRPAATTPRGCANARLGSLTKAAFAEGQSPRFNLPESGSNRYH